MSLGTFPGISQLLWANLLLVQCYSISYQLLQIEKYSKLFLWNVWNVLMYQEEKRTDDPVHVGSNDQITTTAKLLDITHKSYGFNADLIETIN